MIQGLILASSLTAVLGFAWQIIGAGSSFIYPALSHWTQAYNAQDKIKINYEPIGSGGGIKQLQVHTVDFATTDMPLAKSQLNENNWLQFPLLMGGVVPVVNIQGVQNNQLILNGKVLADIYMNKVTKWDDPEIVALNPGIKLPEALIITIHRSDDSGSTYNFTSYLSKLNPTWNDKVGANTTVAWPGFGLGAKDDAGMATQLQNIPNSIGYIAYSYAIQNHLLLVKLQNQAGKIITASSASFAAAAQNADWPHSQGLVVNLIDEPGEQSWPIVATTFVVVPNQHSSYAKNSRAVLKFFAWAYQNGETSATQLNYVPLPQDVYHSIESQWNKQLPGWNT